MRTGASVFSEIISRDDQYEVAKARAEIAFKFHIASLVAFNLKAIIAKRIADVEVDRALGI